jgi:outer membrane receptor protein involved in Fe transport
VDIRLRKDFPSFAGTTLGVSANVYNLFNYRNFTDFALVAPSAPNFGQANALLSDPRRVELGVEYNF